MFELRAVKDSRKHIESEKGKEPAKEIWSPAVYQ